MLKNHVNSLPERASVSDFISPDSAGMVPECAGMMPGCKIILRYVFSGVPLGYGDVAKRFKFAVPHRVLGVF